MVISSHSRLFLSAIYDWCNLSEKRIKNNDDIYMYIKVKNHIKVAVFRRAILLYKSFKLLVVPQLQISLAHSCCPLAK